MLRLRVSQIIVATDVAARGLDIPGVDMIFHYRLPNEQEGFVHRTGRTGRAGNAGINVILCGQMEERQVRYAVVVVVEERRRLFVLDEAMSVRH